MKQKKFRRLLSVALVLVMLLSALPVVSLAAGTSEPTSDQPFKRGTLSSNSYRIPAMVTLNDGTLVAAADARWNTTFDGGGLDTAVAYSTDDGANWTNYLANYLGDNGDEYNGSNSTAFIDPALATDGKTVYMLCDLYPYGVALNGSGNTSPSTAVGFNSDGTLKLAASGSSTYDCYLKDGQIYDSSNNVVPGYTVDAYFNITGTDGTDSNLFFSDSPYQVVRTGYLYLTKSNDGGKSWSKPTLIPNVKTSSEQVCLVGPGRGLVTGGKIIFPVYSYTNGDQQMGFIYSSDGGATWSRSANFTGDSWSSESAVVELSDGTLRFFYRNGNSKLYYADYADGKWGSAVNTRIATNSNTQISAISLQNTVDGKQVILVSCPTGSNNAGSADSSASARLNGRIQIGLVDSENHTMTWETPIDATTNNSQFMYSCLTELSNGKVAILYENKESNWGTGDNSYYTMDFQTYDLGLDFDSTGSTEEEEEEKDTITSSGGPTTSYVLDTDGLDGGAQYLIVYKNSATASSGVAINTSKGSVNVTIEGDKAIPDGDASAALWTITSYTSWFSTYYYLTNGSYYLYPSISIKWGFSYSLNCTATQTGVSISGSNGTYSIANTSENSYVNYNNGWTASKSRQGLYFYKYTAGTASWKVDPALQEQQIAKLTVSNDGYTTDSWNDYQSALNEANQKLSEVKAATYVSEDDAKSALDELIELVDALAAAKNNLKKTVSITVNYQAGSTIVKSETLSVAEDATSVTLSNTIVGSDGKTYDVGNTTLTLNLASTKTYTVDVTECEGKEITIRENETTTISVTLENGQTVEWSSADSNYVGVAGKYDATKDAYTNQAIVAGNNVTTAPVSVTGTVYNADGTVAGTYKWLVTVTEADTTGDARTVRLKFDIEKLQNCTLYYSINGGELVEIKKTDLQPTTDSNGNTYYYLDAVINNSYTNYGHGVNISFFAAPDEGYALTYMAYSSNQAETYDYYTISDGNPDGSGSEAWPFDDPTHSEVPTSQTDSAWKNNSAGNCTGYGWSLLEGNMTLDQWKVMMSTAIALGCDGVQLFTKNTNGTTFEADLTFVAQKLPTMEKKITSIIHDGTTMDYTDGMKVELGDTINYSVVVTRYATNATYGTITYDNEKLTDALTNNNGIRNPDMGTSTTSDKTYTYTTSLTLTMDNFAKVVKDGKITNTAEFSYSYSSQYSAGSLTSDASAVAEITVNVPEYVIDFGLPVTIDLSKKLGGVAISEGTAKFGTVTGNGTSFTYTPTKVLTGKDHVTLTLANGQSYGVNIIPASNVLYEDNFLTVNPDKGQDYKSWTQGSTISGTQSADQSTLYGYDDAYENDTGESMNSAWSINGLTSGNGSKYLTTEFYGTGFDLIGTAGPDTGYVYLLIQGPTSKLIIIDTSYVDGSETTLHQVPLAHVEGLPEGNYTVNIRAAYRAATVVESTEPDSAGESDDTETNSAKAGTMSTSAVVYSLNDETSALDDIYAMVDELLMDGFDFDDFELVYADPNSPLAALDNSRATYALDDGSNDNVNLTSAGTNRPEGTTVTIDGYRVYRSSNNSAYMNNEQGVTYVNVLHAGLDNESFTAYVEGEDGKEWTQTDYEANGGPQNEIYLGNGTDAIAFKVSKANAVVQISARAVSGTAKLQANGKEYELKSSTEMYYEVTADADGIIAISNNGDGMLALGNLKLPKGVTSTNVSAVDAPAVFALLRMAPAPVEPEEPEEPEVFTPEKLDIKVKSINVIRNKLVTVTVTASMDVAELTINGKTLKPINSLLVKRGWSSEYVYVLTDTVKRSESKSYEIIAYDANGLASEPKIVTG